MDWLGKLFFPNSNRDMRRKGMNTLLLVAGVTLALSALMTFGIYIFNSSHH